VTANHDLLRTAKDILDRAEIHELCQACWQVVPIEGDHECDPVERARAIVRATGFTFVDHRKRARGYGVI
jgi:hypothetical protein